MAMTNNLSKTLDILNCSFASKETRPFSLTPISIGVYDRIMRTQHITQVSKYFIGIGAALLLLAVVLPIARATDSEFRQVIATGTLTTDILDENEDDVASPLITLTPLSVAPICQTSTGTYGSNTQRIYIDNPGAATDGWVLSLAATSGASSQWDSGSEQYDFNDPAGSGCTNGQLSINPAAATVHLDGSSTLTDVSMGASAGFNQGVVDDIELVNAGSTSDTVWRGYITGIGVSQAVPASTPAGTYAIDLTQTVVAS